MDSLTTVSQGALGQARELCKVTRRAAGLKLRERAFGDAELFKRLNFC